MRQYASERFVKPNGDKILEGIKKSGITQDKLSTMVLGKNPAYISQSIARGSFDIEQLQKLCQFLGLSYDECIIKDVPKKEESVAKEGKSADAIPQLETLIVGMNTMYEMQKEYTEVIKSLLVEIKALNQKQNRLENALGQIVQNSIIIKETENKIADSTNAVRSQINLANGRLKDLVDWSKKYDKTTDTMVQQQARKISS